MGVLAYIALMTLAVVFASRVVYASLRIVKDQNERVKNDNAEENYTGPIEIAEKGKGLERETSVDGVDEENKKEA